MPAVMRNPSYQAVVPYYTFAQCPICGHIYREQGDTNSLFHWGGKRGFMPTFYFPTDFLPTPARCSHWMGIHRFVNLHNVYPSMYENYNNATGEVPYVTNYYFRDDIATRIVMHALPVCTIQDNQFVPTHTVFSLTYFSENPAEVEQRYYKEAFFDDFPAIVIPPGRSTDPVYFDLAYWAEQGLLGWMDWTQSDVPLRLGKDEELPDVYRNIQGERCPYELSIYSTKPNIQCM